MNRDSLLDPQELRRSVVRMARAGNSVHIACAFSLVEIVSVLYSRFVTHEKAELANPIRDHVILSKGHGVMAIYAAFGKLGWIEQVHLDLYFSDGSLLHGLAEAKIPGLEVCSGSLGHGLPIATGMALGLKRQKASKRVYCIVGDGELNEGPMWEAILFASHHGLSNLTVIVDANGFQAMGKCEEVSGLEPLADKFSSFGFQAINVDGHDVAALETALRQSPGTKPKAIIARTVKGKGLSWMEHDNEWHYRRLSDELFEKALKELGGA